jgi:cobalt/nickel transport system permease protein
MHIPDGFLATPVWAGLDAAAAPAVAWLARRAGRDFDESRIPMLGIMGAFVFAAQMINFPVGVGTSGHLLGGALLAQTLGPSAAAVTMTAILAIQALVFQDGGVLALGANVCNMALVGVLAGYLPLHALGYERRRLAAFLGGALSVLAGAVLAIAELLVSGVGMPGSVLAVTIGLFAITAVIEGAITSAVVGAIGAVNPGWMRQPQAALTSKALTALGAIALLVATGGAFVASTAPDGLDSLAEKIGLGARARVLLTSPMPDYQAHWFSSEAFGKVAAGLAGLVMIFAVTALLGKWLARRRKS